MKEVPHAVWHLEHDFRFNPREAVERLGSLFRTKSCLNQNGNQVQVCQTDQDAAK